MKRRGVVILAACLVAGLLCGLLLYRLGSLTSGLSDSEVSQASATLGWHGIYHAPFYLPLKLIRSVVFILSNNRSPAVVHLPNVIFGFLSVVSLAGVVYLWYGRRYAILTTLMFATSAWTLHVSRLVSYDVLYLWGISSLLLAHGLVYKYEDSALAWYFNLFIWGVLLTIPGFIWLVLVDVYWQRSIIKDGWETWTKWWQRLLSVILPLLFIPLIALKLTRVSLLKTWLGLPDHFATPLHLIKQLVAVPVHLFIRGPEYPSLWLAKAPLLDGFSLALVILGIYFYLKHLKAGRAKLLASLFFVSVFLIGLGGPASLSLVVVLAYVTLATGLAYLVRGWLKVFPYNPVARTVGLGLVTLAVIFSCLYNLRAYFVAWPNNPATKATFNRRL